jgi:hypothetical protein
LLIDLFVGQYFDLFGAKRYLRLNFKEFLDVFKNLEIGRE